MNDSVAYNISDNLDTVMLEKVIDTVSVQSNNYFIFRNQRDSSEATATTTFQAEQNDSIFSNASNFLLSEEINQNEQMLPVQYRNYQNQDWITIILVLAFVLLVSVRAMFQKYLSSLFQSVVNYSTSFRMFRERNFSFLHAAFRLEVLYYIILSVFVYQLLVIQHFEEEATRGIIFFAQTAGFIVIYFLAKKFVYWFLGFVSGSISETSEFLFNLDNYNRAASIVLFPVVALIAYYPFGSPRIIAIAGIIVVGSFYLMLLRRGSIILLKKQFSIFYLFLYLCTLELLPLLLIYKIAIE